MAKTGIGVVQTAANDRRANAGTGPNAADPFALSLACMSGSTAYMTVSVALCSDAGNFAVYAAQNGQELSAPIVEYLDGFDCINATAALFGDGKSAPSGLHAEMIIIRYLYANGILVWGKEVESARQYNIRMVCIGKLVCADCSGWLRAHGIPHFKGEADSAAAQWIHPRTGALYSGGKNVKFYANAAGNSFTRTSADTPPAKAGALARLNIAKSL